MTYIFTGPNKSPIFFNYLFIYITCQIFHVCAKQLVLLLTCFDLLSFCWCRYSGTWLSAPVDTATKASWCLSICAVEPKHVQGHYVCELKVFRQHLNRRVKVWRRHREWYADCCTNRVTVSVMLCDCLSDCCVTASASVQRDIEIRFFSSGNLLFLLSGTRLFPPRWQCSPAQSAVYQRITPVFGRGEDEMACL